MVRHPTEKAGCRRLITIEVCHRASEGIHPLINFYPRMIPFPVFPLIK
jgi:hypothetical protein